MSATLKMVDSWTGVSGVGFLGVISGDWDFATREALNVLHRIDNREQIAKCEISRRVRRRLVEDELIPPAEVDELSSEDLIACYV